MDRHEEVGAVLVGEIGAIAQGHEHVAVPAERHLHPEPVLHQAGHPAGHVEDHVLLHDPARPDGARVVAAVTGVEHDEPQRLHAPAPRFAGARHVLGPVDVQHQAVGVLQHAVLDLARGAAQHHPQHGRVPDGLQPHLLHEPVADLLHPRAAQREAGEPHPHFLVTGHHRVGELAAGLDHHPREARVRPVAQFLERHGALRGGRGLARRLPDRLAGYRDRNAGRQARQALAEEIARDQPAPSLHPRGRVERHRLPFHGGARLPAHELRRALVDDENPAITLDRPRALEQRGQVVGREEGIAIVHHADGEEPEAASPILHLERLRPRRPRHAQGHRQTRAKQEGRRRSWGHDPLHPRHWPF